MLYFFKLHIWQQQWDVLVDIIGSLEKQYIPSKMVEINRDDKFGEKLPNHIRLQITNLKKTQHVEALHGNQDTKYISHIL